MKRLAGVIVIVALAAALAVGGRHLRFDQLFPQRPGSAGFETYRAAAWEDLGRRGLRPGQPVFIRIFKKSSELELWMEGDRGWELFRTFAICRWSGRLGPKLKLGDKQAPEGFYSVRKAQLNPHSRHHLSFNLGFPNAFDRAHSRTGNYLMVHGGCTSAGCYAMTDRQVDVIYRLVEAALDNGQRAVPVHAFPFRMTERNLARYGDPRWSCFWAQLKTGYDAFERARQVPRVKVADGAYVVN